MLQQLERPYESMTKEEKKTAFAAICYWYDTGLTHSVYVLGCMTAEEAICSAHGYFIEKKGGFCKQIKRIEVKPQGRGVFDPCNPDAVRSYGRPRVSD